jgi:photosystem II stability/assembly factor-like uncharacterized protein
MSKFRVWALVGGLVALTACGSSSDGGGDPAECGMCSRMVSKCGWPAAGKARCTRTCSQYLEHPARCESQYKAALACFNDDSNWTCSTNTEEAFGCKGAITAYDDCRYLPWQPITGLAPATRVLAADARDPAVLWAASQQAEPNKPFLQRSVDHGASWTAASGTLASPFISGFGARGDSLVLYRSGFQSNTYVSSDGGASWQEQGPGVGERDAFSMLLADDQGQRIYALVDEEGFYRSDDGGKTWAKKSEGLPTQSGGPTVYIAAQTLAMHPSKPNTLLLGTGNTGAANTGKGIFRSDDGGDSWKAVPSGLDEQNVSTLQWHASGKLVAATDSGDGIEPTPRAFTSGDASSWKPFFGGTDDDHQMVLDACVGDGGRVYLLLSELMLVTTGEGGRWRRLTKIDTAGTYMDHGARLYCATVGGKQSFVVNIDGAILRHVEP